MYLCLVFLFSSSDAILSLTAKLNAQDCGDIKVKQMDGKLWIWTCLSKGAFFKFWTQLEWEWSILWECHAMHRFPALPLTASGWMYIISRSIYTQYVCILCSLFLKDSVHSVSPFQAISVLESFGAHHARVQLLLVRQSVLAGDLNGVPFLAVAVRAALTVQTSWRVVWVQGAHRQALKRVLVRTEVITFCRRWAFQT